MSTPRYKVDLGLSWEAGVIAGMLACGFFWVSRSIDRWCDLEAAKAGFRPSAVDEKTWVYDPTLLKEKSK